MGGHSYRESDGTERGSDPVVVDIEGVRFGLAVCYDLRFPELYRRLTIERRSEVLMVPADFTTHTGMPLGGAVAGPRDRESGLCGRHRAVGSREGVTSRPYGHSMVVDPWGTVLAQAPDGDGVIVADLDFERLAQIRSSLPALEHLHPSMRLSADLDPAARPG